MTLSQALAGDPMPEGLPEDPACLRGLLGEALQAIRERDHRIALLQHYLMQLRRWQFGIKSERLDEGQGLFAFYGKGVVVPGQSAPAEKRPARKPPSNGHGRRVIPEGLPRRIVLHDIPEKEKTCPTCGKMRTAFAREVAEQLEYHPASLHVIQHVRPQYACADCQEHVVTAPPATSPIEKGLAGPGLLAHVLVSKYADHLPLYRQSGILLRHGVDLARSTLCQWVGQCVGLLSPIVTAMKRDILQSKAIQTDDTPVRVLDPGSGKTHQGRLWTYLGDKDHASAVFEFSMTRQQCWPKAFLGDFSRYLQADAYTGYDTLFTGGKMIEVGCWAHARRKFFEAKDTDRERSRWAVDAIRTLYQVEWDAQALDAEARKALRQERSAPILEGIHAWLDAQGVQVRPKAPMGEAIHYALAQWTALNRYLEDGDLAIDNNACERLLRGACVGRKNYLFFGSEEGGRWGAVLYSLVESCKLHRIDPFAYLKDVLVRTSTHPMSRVMELTPRLWKPPSEGQDTS